MRSCPSGEHDGHCGTDGDTQKEREGFFKLHGTGDRESLHDTDGSGGGLPLIVLIPTIRTTKPIRISPTDFVDFFLLTVRSRIPITATTPVSVAVERSLARLLPESR